MKAIYQLVDFYTDIEENKDCTYIKYPGYLIGKEAVTAVLEASELFGGIRIQAEKSFWTLEVPGVPAARTEIIKQLFSELNGYPYFNPGQISDYGQTGTPLVSCIILLTANDLFVYHQLIPSLIQNSKGYAIEIIIVCNGIGINKDLFKPFNLVESDFAWVSRGYNNGTKKAKGEYIALFHDDCLINDAEWIPKSIKALEQGYFAATPQLQNTPGELVRPKFVPLMIRRDVFYDLNLLDENHFYGFEDSDLALNVMMRGKELIQVDIDYYHFMAMSTALMFGKHPQKLKKIFAYLLLSTDICKQFGPHIFADALERSPELTGYITMQKSYLLHKYKELFKKMGRVVEDSGAVFSDFIPDAGQIMNLTKKLTYLDKAYE